MAEKRRFLDVWIVDSNTVYREVPFTVVADWVQQGRLLADDKLCPSGTKKWERVGDSQEFSPYLPKAEPFRVEDRAEALEPVHLDFAWKKPHSDEDDDVDMIPLIDVSLVLLIFFMLTASGVGIAGMIATPPTEFGQATEVADTVMIGVNLENDEPVYSLAVGARPPEAEDRGLRSRDDLLGRLRDLFGRVPGRVQVTINADTNVKSGLVRDLTAALDKPEFRRHIDGKYIGVSQKAP
ncbi:MAG TPA: biopolymer transporter ExbD [Gemmataceae bacterium]|jgi:biopolymer transport protein ExbD|nr:biopolymer transporter ExbD [Gemmataceae bacterium]